MTRSTRARSAKGGAVPQYGGDGQLEHRLAVIRARALAAGAVGFVLFALLAGYFLSRPATYTATSVLSVRPADSRTNDQVVTLLLSRYTAVGQSRQTLAAAAQTAGVSTDTLLNGTAVLNPPLTANIRITVSLRNATAAAAAANAITATVLQAAHQDGLVSADQVERAAPAGATSGAGYALKLALALVVGLVGAAATASISEARRPRLRTRQQLRRLAGVPVPLWLTSLPGRAQRRVHTSTADERDAMRLRAVVCSRVPAGVDADGQRLVLVMSPYEATRAPRWAQSLATSLADDGRPVLLQSRSQTHADPEQRWTIARRLVHDTTLDTVDRVAGALVVLYAQPLVRICALTTDDVQIDGKTVTVNLGEDPLELQEPFATLIGSLPMRRRAGVAEQVPGNWLFPGQRAGRHLAAVNLGNRLRALGIEPRRMRLAALDQLTKEIPPAMLTGVLGLKAPQTVRRTSQAGGDWARYAANRST